MIDSACISANAVPFDTLITGCAAQNIRMKMAATRNFPRRRKLQGGCDPYGVRDSMHCVSCTELGRGLVDVAPHCLFAQPLVFTDLSNAMAER